MKRTQPLSKRKARWAAIHAGVFCALVIVLGIGSASAADLAILRNGFSIRHERRVEMGSMTRLYFSADNTNFTDVPTADIASYEKDLAPPPAPTRAVAPAAPGVTLTPVAAVAAKPAVPLNQVVDSASAAYHLDPDLVNSVIHAESGFNTRARSPKGAQGLMQLMPQTANQLGVNNAFDPQDNVNGGTRYLRELLERYNFDLVKALAAYNAGPHRVEQYKGVPPFNETRAYVARIVHEYNKKKIAQEKEAKSKELAAKKAATAGRSSSGQSSGRTSTGRASARSTNQTAKSAAPSTPVTASQ